MKILPVTLSFILLITVTLVQASPYDSVFDSLLRSFFRKNEKLIDPLSLKNQSWIVPLKHGTNVSLVFNFSSSKVYGLKRLHRYGPITQFTDENNNRRLKVPLASTNVTLQSTVTSVGDFKGKQITSLPIGMNIAIDTLKCIVNAATNTLKRNAKVHIEEMDNLRVTFYNPTHKPAFADIFFQLFSKGANLLLKEQARNLTQYLLESAFEDKIDHFPNSSNAA